MREAMETTEPFSKALRALLQERGLSETALAAMTPYNQNTINRYIHGQRGREISKRTVRTMTDIARALEVDPEYFAEIRIYRMWQELAEDVRAGYIRTEDFQLMREGARLRRQLESSESTD